MNRQYGALSGVAVLLILVNHSVHFGLQVSPVAGGWLGALTVLQALGAFAVPAFLFISGAFLSYAGTALTLTFVRNSLGRILWPYLVWSLVFYGLVVVGGGVREPASVYLRHLLVGYPYHFVPLLVFWYLAAPIMIRVARRHGTLLLVAVGAWQILLLAVRFPAMFGVEAAPWWLRALEPPVLFIPMSDWAVYFPLGLVLSMHDASLRPRLLRVRGLAVGVTGLFFLVGVLDALRVLPAPWARFAAPLPIMLILPTVNRTSIPGLRRLEVLGRQSYGIYLTHFVAMNALLILAGRMDLRVLRQPLVSIPVFFVIALGASLLGMRALAVVPATRRLYRYLFGIVPTAAALRHPVAGAMMAVKG